MPPLGYGFCLLKSLSKNQPLLLISEFLLRTITVQRIRATDVNFPQPPEQKQKLACSKNLLLQDTFFSASEHAEEGWVERSSFVRSQSKSLCRKFARVNHDEGAE